MSVCGRVCVVMSMCGCLGGRVFLCVVIRLCRCVCVGVWVGVCVCSYFFV